MKFKLHILFLLCFNVLFVWASGANKVFNDSMRMISFDRYLETKKSIDSSLTNFHNQIPYLQNNRYASLGTILLPQRSLMFKPSEYFGFRLLDDVYGLFDFKSESQHFYNVAKPLTDMGFGVGSKKESYFSFFHTQNLEQRLNIGSELRTARTASFYKNQNPHFVNFSVFVNYTSKNKKYVLLASTAINRLFHKENGGVNDSTLFDFNGNRQNSEIVRTNLNNASYKVFRNSFSVKQLFNLHPKTDTLHHDFSLENYGTTHFYHQFGYTENWMRFSDSLENYMNATFRFDTLKTQEYLYHQKIENSFGYLQTKNSESNRAFSLDLGVKHSYNYISQPRQRTNFNNIWVYANADFNVLNNIKLNANYTQAISGYNLGDFQLQSKLFVTKRAGSNWFDVGIKASTQLSEPTFIQQNYWNSHFKWDNNFKKISISQLGVFAQGEKTTIEINYNQLLNYVYFDETLNPRQSNMGMGLLQANVIHPIKLNKLHINSSILYQKNITHNDVLRLPEVLLTEQLFFEGYLFKKSLLSQAGIELNYSTANYGNGYAPLLNQFYLQNKSLVGGYPQLDVFFNFKIQQVRIFIKMNNVNYGLYPTTVYYQTPGNPMYNRLFRLGLIWRFWD